MSETVRTDARYCKHGAIPVDKTRTWDTETCRQCAREEAEAASALATIEEQRQRIEELERASEANMRLAEENADAANRECDMRLQAESEREALREQLKRAKEELAKRLHSDMQAALARNPEGPK